MTVFKKKTELAKGVFWPSYLIGIAVIVLGIANQKPFGSILDAGLNWVSDNFGWWLVLFALILVLLVFGLAFSKAGDVVIGGAGAKPEYTMWQWFSMSLKRGIGTGILFWAMGEPIFHMAAPPAAAGAQPFTREAGLFAISQTMLHWTIAQYAMYSLCAVGVALMAYNRRPYDFSVLNLRTLPFEFSLRRRENRRSNGESVLHRGRARLFDGRRTYADQFGTELFLRSAD